MFDKTQVLAGVKETIRYASGNTAETKIHRFSFDIPDKFLEDEKTLKDKARQIIQSQIGNGHDLFITLRYWDSNRNKQRVIDYEYFPKKMNFKTPDNFTRIGKSGKSGAGAGIKFDAIMGTGLAGAKKGWDAVGKGLDWFFMEGEYAKNKKKTTGKRTTTRKTTTTKKK